MTPKEIDEIIKDILRRKLLIYFSMQPKQERLGSAIAIEGTTGMAWSDAHILKTWLKTDAIINSQESCGIIKTFNYKLTAYIHKPGIQQEFQRAMSRLIKASLKTGTLVDGDPTSMKIFLQTHTNIARFLQINLYRLDIPNEAFCRYLVQRMEKDPNFKILAEPSMGNVKSRHEAGLTLKAARERLPLKIQSELKHAKDAKDAKLSSSKQPEGITLNLHEEIIQQPSDKKEKAAAIELSKLKASTTPTKVIETTKSSKEGKELKDAFHKPTTEKEKKQEKNQKLIDLLHSLQKNNLDYLKKFEEIKKPKEKIKREGTLFFADTDKKYNNAYNLEGDITTLLGYPNLEPKHIEGLLRKYERLERESMGLMSHSGNVESMLKEVREELNKINRSFSQPKKS